MSLSPTPRLERTPTWSENASVEVRNGHIAERKRRRAAGACTSCRSRKVRCDVLALGHGTPCTNCRLDSLQCLLVERKRTRRSTISEHAQHISITQSSVEDYPAPSDDLPNHVQGRRTTIHTQNPDRGISPSSHSNPHHVISHATPSELDGLECLPSSTAGQLLEVESSSTGRESHSHLGHSVSSHVPAAPAFISPDSEAYSPNSIFLPAFVAPLTKKIPRENLEFLEKRGALSVPEPRLRMALIHAYIDFVYCYLPAIDLPDFLENIERRDGQISLLLFQAIMFAGSTFVDMSNLRTAGFRTRREARVTLFNKTRLLYDFDCDVDRVSVLQALLLMTYWYETPTDLKDAGHWMGVTIDLAYTIGLQRNTEKSTMPIKRRRLLKRIWWSCFTRDALLSLAMRRPIRVTHRDSYNVPMLDLNDFAIGTFEIRGLPEPFLNCAFVYDEEVRRKSAVMCIEHAKLCVCISETLITQYALSGVDQAVLDPADGDSTTSVSLLPRSMDSEVSRDAQNCDSQLRSWLAALPAEAIYKPINREMDGVQDLYHSVGLHLGTLHLVYWTTLIALHRPHSIDSQYHPWPASSGIVQDAALAIGDIIANLHSVDMVRNLPPISVTVLMTAVIYDLLGTKNGDKDTQQRCIEGFFGCMQAMQCLRDSYPMADFATALLEVAIAKSDVSIPLSASQDWRTYTAVSLHDYNTVSVDEQDTRDMTRSLSARDMLTKTPPFCAPSSTERAVPNSNSIDVNQPPRNLRFGGDGWLGREEDWKNSSLWEDAVTSEWFDFVSLDRTAWE